MGQLVALVQLFTSLNGDVEAVLKELDTTCSRRRASNRWKIVLHKLSMEHEIRPAMHYGWGKVHLIFRLQLSWSCSTVHCVLYCIS
ncbi:hypothetical protein Q8A67_006599 [Cirrhinus molitorella]|uniref:Uncharacterized protein n=1 Tax=Cirrhinus molitorella TaxID=172907 RepID=A0AA88PUM9_9TELE|nr:hypothetical protein Q8A67_006599 [Cirrhinus molitorella]